MSVSIIGKIQQRLDSTANWDYVNPVLPDRVIGWEVNNLVDLVPVGLKMGDGIAAWDDLPYWFTSSAVVQVETDIVGGVTSNPITVPYTGMVNPSIILRNMDGTNYAGSGNNTDTGVSIILQGDDNGSGKFADTFKFIIKP